MLIQVDRHSKEELEHWERQARFDRLYAQASRLEQKVESAILDIKDFARRGPCWCGISWGKDSMVLAGLCEELRTKHSVNIPLVWVRIKPIENPHCVLVRNAYLARPSKVPIQYVEIPVWCNKDSDGWHASGTIEAGFESAAKQLGTVRSVRGIRGTESATRAMSVGVHGISTANACRPIAHWKPNDVFAYLESRELPVHPAYAFTWNGQLDRARIRVGSLAGRRGDGHERRQWEQTYYPDEMAVLEDGGIPAHYYISGDLND